MQLKIENIENEMDIRVESLISEINQYRYVYRVQLDFKKWEFNKNFKKKLNCFFF